MENLAKIMKNEPKTSKNGAREGPGAVPGDHGGPRALPGEARGAIWTPEGLPWEPFGLNFG